MSGELPLHMANTDEEEDKDKDSSPPASDAKKQEEEDAPQQVLQMSQVHCYTCTATLMLHLLRTELCPVGARARHCEPPSLLV